MGVASAAPPFFLPQFVNKFYFSINYIDLISSTTEGVTTLYEYFKYQDNGTKSTGLVKRTVVNNEIETSSAYNPYNLTLLSTTDEFGTDTNYLTDTIWGVITQCSIETPADEESGTEYELRRVTDSFDDDRSHILSRTFYDAETPAVTTFTYSGGNLFRLNKGSLTYEFAYNKGRVSSVIKNDNTIETHAFNDTPDANGLRSYSDSYPSATNSFYSVSGKLDKYDRVKEITNKITNSYDINPTYQSANYQTEGADNSLGKLSESQDLVTNKKTRYAYDKDRLTRVGVFNSSDVKISEEIYTYDQIGRIKTDTFYFDLPGTNSIKHSTTYVKSADDPAADNRVYTHYCYLNGVRKAYSYNRYDNYNRLSLKGITLTHQNLYYTRSFNYDKTRLESVADVFSGHVKSRNDYTYDQYGRIHTDTHSSATTTACETSYVYDSFGQLIRENNQALDKTFIYSYNGIGNITKVESYPYTTGDVSGTPTTVDYTYSDDRLTNFNGKSVTYNSIGYPTSYDGKNYAWQSGRLRDVTRGNSSQPGSKYENCRFTYDGYGRRIAKNYTYDNNISSTSDYSYKYDTTYVYDESGRLIRETLVERMTYSGGGSTTYEFVYLYDESGIIGVLFGTSLDSLQPYYYRRNAQGDVTAIYDAQGTLKVEYAYDAWGNCTVTYGISHSLARINPIRYRGYYYDRETGFYYLNARYYNPEWRRFISPDSTKYLDPENPNGLNLYAYCYNDPVNYADPNGHEALPNWLKWVIGGVAFGGAIALTVISGGSLAPVFIGMASSIVLGGLIEGTLSAINGESFSQGFWDGAADGAMVGGIFALLSASVSLVKHWGLIHSRGVVIGKGMGRVEFFADQAALSKYSPMKGYNLIKGNGKIKWRVKLADTLSVAHNKSWIKRVMRLNKPIYDIGLGGAVEAGAWYGMELEQVANYALHLGYFI